MKKIKKYLPQTIKVIIAFLFLLSAVAKLYPSPYFAITTFEFTQLFPMGFTEKTAAYFSRILIGVEFALGILILQNHFLKKLVLPAIFLMLLVFTIHLSYITFTTGGNTGNCGCFGSLLPMTPLEAIAKNIIAMLLIVVLYKNLPTAAALKHNFWILTTTFFGCILVLFMLAPINRQTTSNFTTSKIQETQIDSVVSPISAKIDNLAPAQNIAVAPLKTDTKPATTVVSSTVSGYANYFSNIDKGTQVLCFFAPGCDHCRATAKELTEISKTNPNFPIMQIIFMDEEANLIPEFFQVVGAEYPYKIVGIIDFWKLLGTGKQVPGVKIIKDGKMLKYYFGSTGTDKFDTTSFKKNLDLN